MFIWIDYPARVSSSCSINTFLVGLVVGHPATYISSEGLYSRDLNLHQEQYKQGCGCCGTVSVVFDTLNKICA